MFIVVEIQTDKTSAILATAYEDMLEAENKYHTVLAAASISSVPVHSCSMLTEDGELIKHDSYDHREENENVD